MLVFLDTEFTRLPDPTRGYLPPPKLISIGMASQNSMHTFYAETKGVWALHNCSAWVKEHVLPHLGAGNCQMSRRDLREALQHFFVEIRDPVKIACDSKIDWEFLLDALGADLPVNLNPQWQDISHLREHLTDAVAHHALKDAQQNQMAWLRTNGVEVIEWDTGDEWIQLARVENVAIGGGQVLIPIWQITHRGPESRHYPRPFIRYHDLPGDMRERFEAYHLGSAAPFRNAAYLHDFLRFLSGTERGFR